MQSKPKDYELKIIHSEIMRGLSKFKLSHSFVYIKHSSMLDDYLYEEKRQELTKQAIENYIPYENDKLNSLIELGLWSQDSENEIRNERFYLENLRKTLKKLFRRQEIESVSNDIRKAESKLFVLNYHRNEMLGLTLEKFVQSRLQRYYIIYSLYKDESLTDRYLSEEDYNLLDDEILSDIFTKYESVLSKFYDKNIKYIAISPFFYNGFSICDNDPMKYYGKPIINLSTLQINLFQYACFFKYIFSEGGDKIPEDWRDDPEKLEDWYNASDARKEMMERSVNSDGVGIVTKDKDDMKKLGLDPINGEHQKIKEMMKKNGGKLNFQDHIKANS